jgi:ABC-type nitrate/sulfonate/bicarbonate transport system permease component
MGYVFQDINLLPRRSVRGNVEIGLEALSMVGLEDIATPLVMIIPLVVIWVGIGQQARLLFVFLLTLWHVLLNTVASIRYVGRAYSEVGTAFGLSEGQVLRCITIPGAAP